MTCRSAAWLCAVLLCPAVGRAGAGVAGADILKLPIEARGWGLGMAYSAIADDLGAMAYNPAGMAASGEHELRFTYMSFIQGTGYESLLGAWPLGRWGKIGGMLLYRQVGTISNGDQVQDPRSSFYGANVSDSAFGLYVACRFSHLLPGTRFVAPFSIGFGLKNVSQSIGNYRAAATALDLGVLAAFDTVRAAVSIQNMGGGFTFPGDVEAEADALPQTIRLAGAIIPYEDATASLTLALENASFMGVSSDQKFSAGTITARESLNLLGFGVEYWRLKKMGVRLGYVMPWGAGADTYAAGRGLAVGLSFRLFSRLLAYQLDFAYRPMSVGSSRQDAATVSLSLRF